MGQNGVSQIYKVSHVMNSESRQKVCSSISESRYLEPRTHHRRRAKAAAVPGPESSPKKAMLSSLLETRAWSTPRCSCRRSWADALAAWGAGSYGARSAEESHSSPLAESFDQRCRGRPSNKAVCGALKVRLDCVSRLPRIRDADPPDLKRLQDTANPYSMSSRCDRATLGQYCAGDETIARGVCSACGFG